MNFVKIQKYPTSIFTKKLVHTHPATPLRVAKFFVNIFLISLDNKLRFDFKLKTENILYLPIYSKNTHYI